jgi:hypothetical protein
MDGNQDISHSQIAMQVRRHEVSEAAIGPRVREENL